MPVEKTALWLLNSGIQNESTNPALHGGVHGWYDVPNRSYPFLYSEITGYALSTFVFLYRVTGQRIWLNKAEAAGKWLIRSALHESGGILTRHYFDGDGQTSQYSFKGGWLYAFDTAMAGYGLVQIQREKPRKEFSDALQKIFHFFESTLKKKKGIYFPYYETGNKNPGENSEKWSDESGAFHAKLALFFIDYYRLTGKKESRAAALDLLNQTLKLQKRDGRFVTRKMDDSTLLHPHAYALEGLVYGGWHLKQKKYLDAAWRGLDWAKKAISKNGFVCALYDGKRFLDFERVDVISQILRVGALSFAIKKGSTPIAQPLLKKVRERLLYYQFVQEGQQNGAFLYGSDEDRRIKLHLNSWVSMFALQAIWMYEAYVIKKEPLNLESLV